MNRLNPLISIVIPYYNAEAYIRTCIESVAAQTYKNIEIIAIDNMSTDGGRDIVAEMQSRDPRIRICECETAGLSAARNKGIEVYKGDYLIFVDSDDLISENAVETLYTLAEKEKADLVCGSYRSYGKSGPDSARECRLKTFVSDNKEEIHRYFLTCGKNCNFAWAKLYGRNIFDGVSYPVGKMYEDIAVIPYIIENTTKFVAGDAVIYDYYQHSDSLSYSCETKQQMDGLSAWMENVRFYKENYPSLLPYAYENEIEYAFYLMGRIKRDGIDKNRDIWNETIDRIKISRKESSKTSIKMKAALALFAVSPRLAGSVFSNYSMLRNHTK